ncbi:MAG: 30S ribosomal protein S8 [Defluviitaleaceae bacterium]|nr:30S ribosomal protein S8 [Defluviitaleaceae bacterium]
MMLSDPIADMLTRIRNATSARHTTVEVPSSKMKVDIANILVREGYLKGFEVLQDGVKKTMRITLKYGRTKHDKVIAGIKRISKPGLRVYANCEDLPRVLNGLGCAIVSTNKGILTDNEARQAGIGGEVLAFVW